MKSLTYRDWQAAGYQVKRGEKASGKDKQGRPTFTRDQVDNGEERKKQEMEHA